MEAAQDRPLKAGPEPPCDAFGVGRSSARPQGRSAAPEGGEPPPRGDAARDMKELAGPKTF